MKKTFQVQNIKCNGCANSVKKALGDQFGDIEVNLEVFPREITLEIQEDQIPLLRKKMLSIGYPMIDEELSVIQNVNAKAKSFVSCAIGKIDF